MAGIYFHIPFCKRICAYCDFFKSLDISKMGALIEAMHAELELRHGSLHDRHIRTIYFGGGTPSLCEPQALQGLIDHAARLFDCHDLAECTTEVNPDDLTEEYLARLRDTDINRLSIGIQSFDNAELKLMNRRHTAEQAIEAVRRAQQAGFTNITIDLIFGVSGFGSEILQHNIQTALSLGVQHISAYHLTIEPNTAFGRKVAHGGFAAVPDAVSEAEYLFTHHALTQAGFEHYEISNYALPGFRAQHNAAYWSGVEYLGIGPAAHSFDTQTRHWGVNSIEEYIKGAPGGEETLSERDHFNEYVMTSLRTLEGIDLRLLATQFGQTRLDILRREAAPFLLTGTLRVEKGKMAIPPEKFLVSDNVIAHLFET
ncbi:MAG: radical SAM family heme chaperone HemW [Alistipes sp.]